ncbi:MAG: energy transducer TonB [Flavobacteriales bacterium]|nr:energy transducer TonB [Flavobacteriales bacterium]
MLPRLVLLIAFLVPCIALANDPLDWSELQRLYACDLAFDARYVREDDVHLWVKVVAVLRDRGYSIVPGDHMRVDKMASTDCGYAWNIGKERRWRFYLQKEEGKGHWALLQRSTSSAIPFIHDRAIMHMPQWVELPIAEFDRCMIEFQTCYASADSGNTFTMIGDQARIDSLAMGNPILAQFEKQGRTVTAGHLFEAPERPVPPAPPPVIRDCVLLEQPPRKHGAPSDAKAAPIRLSVLDPTPDSLASRTILRVLVDVDGHIRDATVVRASTPQRDGAALRAVGDLPALEPGRDQGVPTACYLVFPVRFTLPGE